VIAAGTIPLAIELPGWPQALQTIRVPSSGRLLWAWTIVFGSIRSLPIGDEQV
jgi:hypothetical protein